MPDSLRVPRPKKSFPVHVDEQRKNVINIDSLDTRRSVTCFIYCLNELEKKGERDILINLTNLSERQFPNACVPIAAVIDLYKTKGFHFEFLVTEKIYNRIKLDDPLVAEESVVNAALSSLSIVWRFDSPIQAQKLVQKLIVEISEELVCDRGVIKALDWCLYEIMDNIFQHSQQRNGYIMAQAHRETKKVAICISDVGIGIRKSFIGSKYQPKTDNDAIMLSIQQGVTRDNSIGQGNGLWGLFNIVRHNEGGALSITSGSSTVDFINGEPKTKPVHLPVLNDENHAMSSIDIQIDANNPIDVSLALKSSYVTNLTFENFEDENSDKYRISVKENSHGYGTRESARRLRNLILNLLKERPQKVVIDFDGVILVSSSFADELIAKLLVEFGFYAFNRLFLLENVSVENENIIHTVVSQRLKTELESKIDVV